MRLRIFAITLASAGLLLGGASAAVASNGPSPNTQSADNVHFTSTYTETNSHGQPILFQCAGEHIDNSGQGGKVTEEENCALSGPGLSNYAKGDYGNPSGVFGPFPGFPPSVLFFWFSDYNGVVATSWTLHVNGALTMAHISATYPNDSG